MNFLTRKEHREVQILRHERKRDLLPMEVALKRIWEATRITNQLERVKAVNASLEGMEVLTGTKDSYFENRCRAAAHDPAAMAVLLESYPQVEFEKVLSQGGLNTWQLLSTTGVSFEELKYTHLWLVSLGALIVFELPWESRFVSTPNTSVDECRRKANAEKDPQYYGCTLKKEVQDQFDNHFNTNWNRTTWREQRHPLNFVEQFCQLDINEVNRRLKVTSPDSITFAVDLVQFPGGKRVVLKVTRQFPAEPENAVTTSFVI